MLIAKNQYQQLITASRQLEKSVNYSCPSCQGAVYLKVGSVMRPHFAHYQREACAAFSEGETEEHIQGKLQLREWLAQQNIPVEMEAYLPKLKQRPDLLVRIGERKIALEFQCSSIPIEKVAQRTKGYQEAGYEVVWILGEKFKYGRQLTAFQKACLTQYKNQLVLFHYSVSNQRLEYRTNFHLRQNQKMQCRKKSIKKGRFIDIQLPRERTRKQSTIDYEIEHKKLLRQLQFPTHKTKQFLQLIYDKKETLVSMPQELHVTVPSEWMLQNHAYEWKIQFIWWLEQYSKKTILTKKLLIEWIKTLDYHEMPQIEEEQKLQPIFEFIEALVKAEVLKQVRFDKWSIIDYPKRYERLEEKLKNR